MKCFLTYIYKFLPYLASFLLGYITSSYINRFNHLVGYISLFLICTLLFLYVYKYITDSRKREDLYKLDNESLKNEIQERTDDFSEINKELEAFIYSVSHDLNQPLRSITGFSNIIKHKFKKTLNHELKDYIDRMHKSGMRMEEIIRELLKLSRVTRGDVNRSKIELTPILDEIIIGLRINYNHDININIQPNMFAYAELEMVKTVFENLLDNSFKYTEKVNNPTISIGCLNNSCKDSDKSKYSIFYVDDNGIGVDIDDTDKLFELFYKVKFKDPYEGSGVGLSTVYRIIKKHNGDIWIETEVGKGTTVYFTFNKYNET